jgi:hypothetical protein
MLIELKVTWGAAGGAPELGSPQSLEGMRAMFERSSGRFPLEEVRAARKQQKVTRKKTGKS